MTALSDKAAIHSDDLPGHIGRGTAKEQNQFSDFFQG